MNRKEKLLQDILKDDNWDSFESELQKKCRGYLEKRRRRNRTRKILAVAALFVMVVSGSVYLNVLGANRNAKEYTQNNSPEPLKDNIIVQTTQGICDVVKNSHEEHGELTVYTVKREIEKTSDDELFEYINDKPWALVAYEVNRSRLVFLD
jgi:hypothetical protein